ncbi:MAG TPA: hypothetical protein VK009_25980 [Chloroflexota bacterium]|nr:hypothetical protein [Chloroflexota bacterium]
MELATAAVEGTALAGADGELDALAVGLLAEDDAAMGDEEAAGGAAELAGAERGATSLPQAARAATLPASMTVLRETVVRRVTLRSLGAVTRRRPAARLRLS